MRSDQTIPMALDWRPLIASWLMAKCAVRLKRGRPRRSYRPTRRPTRRPSATDRVSLVHRVRRPLRHGWTNCVVFTVPVDAPGFDRSPAPPACAS
jgi:hypothetical protein